jgi:hypothetical protein
MRLTCLTHIFPVLHKVAPSVQICSNAHIGFDRSYFFVNFDQKCFNKYQQNVDIFFYILYQALREFS